MTDALQSTLSLLKKRIAARGRTGINDAAFQLIEQQAPLGEQWSTIAALLQYHGEHNAALSALDAWHATAAPAPRILFERAIALARAGRPVEALSLLDKLPDSFPDPLGNAYMKGTLAINVGDPEAAIRTLGRAVALDPGSGQSWLARVMADPLEPFEVDRLRSAQLLFDTVESVDAGAYFYALGKLENDHGDRDSAFGAFARGASKMQRLQPFDAAFDEALVNAQIADWDRATIVDAQANIIPGNARPIFVTGLPRSGTTLVEQILASHSLVAGGAELALFSIIGRDVGGMSQRAFQNWRDRGGQPQALRELYHHLADQRFPANGRIVDKTLATSRYMGLIAAIFPDAPIIWLRREPVDCAWSVFRNYFIKGVEWSWSLEAIAEFFNQEDRLFKHWTRVLGDQILVVPFDGLVSNPGYWTRQINAHAGLELEPAQLTPDRTARTVITSSVAQVREPINQRGVGASRPYCAKLGEFIKRYRGTSETSPTR